jgi:HAD superfamily hydrolase (TIGR01490 family)
MRLAIFDLDHTLIPFDSGQSWARFLIGEGVLDESFEQRSLEHARRYAEGTMDIVALQRHNLSVLAAHPRVQLEAWRERYARLVAPRIPAAAHALVRRHRDDGALCCIATATTRFIAEPLARALGVEHLVASEAALLPGGEFSGDIAGEPSFRDAKCRAVERWLAAIGRGRADFDRVDAYSDSINDLPLLEYATHPVAVRPDARLRAIAAARGWRVAESLEAVAAA